MMVMVTLFCGVLFAAGLFYFYTWAYNRGLKLGSALGSIAAVNEMKRAINDELAKRVKSGSTDAVH